MYFSIVNLIQKSILQCTRYMVPPPKALPVGHHATLKWRNSGFESNLCVFYRLLLDCIDMHRVFTHFQPNFSPHLYILYGNSTCGAPTAWRALYGAPWRAWWIQTTLSCSGTRCDLVWYSGYALTGSLCESNIASMSRKWLENRWLSDVLYLDQNLQKPLKST